MTHAQGGAAPEDMCHEPPSTTATHTACRLVLYVGSPMGPSFRSGHLLPPDNENFSMSGRIAEKRTMEKTGCSHGYTESASPD